jgi:hypothetical protein
MTVFNQTCRASAVLRATSLTVTTLVIAVFFVTIGIVTPAESQAGAQLRPASTAKSATRHKPSPSRSRYSNRLSSRQSGENRAMRTTRASAERSALGDGRRNGVRLGSSPIPAQSISQTGRDPRRDGVRLAGTPATDWNAWNRATRTGTRSPATSERQSRSGMKVRFRPATRE